MKRLINTVVYIAGPFRGENAWEVKRNVHIAESYAHQVAELGYSFICPHSIGASFDGTMTGEYWLEMTMELLTRCDCVLVVGDYNNSTGTMAEIEKARELNMNIYYSPCALDSA